MYHWVIMAVLMMAFSAMQAQKKWVGLSAAWNDALNWSPAGLPQEADDIILDNTFLDASYTVILPDALVTVRSILVSAAGNNMIRLILPVSNLKSPALMLAATTDALILRKGGVLVNSSGLSSGSSILSNGLVKIENGGRYLHNTRSVHAADIVARLSGEPGTENGIFQFDVPGGAYPVSFSNRTYGKLVLSADASGGSQTYNASGSSNVTIRGDLEMHAGVQLNLDISRDVIVLGNLLQQGGALNLASQANSNTFQLHGNLVQSPGAAITESGTGLPVLALSGHSSQHIACAGSIGNEVTLLINNENGVVLDIDLQLTYKLQFVRGTLKSSASSLLVLADDCTTSGASRDSFVDGPVKKIGDDDFQFPVGKQHDYAPFGISGSGGTKTDECIAEYFLANPHLRYGGDFEAPIVRVSSMEYWLLKRVSGESQKKVQLGVGTYSGATALDKLVVVRWDSAGSRWRNEGNSAWSGVTAGYVRSNDLTPDGVFTIASTVAQQNPLPATYIAVRVAEQRNNVLLSWRLSGDVPAGIFQVEQSADGHNFNAIRVVAGDDHRMEYEVVVAFPDVIKKYFRIHLKDRSGNDVYSPVVTLSSEDGNVTYRRSGSRLDVFLRLPRRQRIDVSVFDMTGKKLKLQSQLVEAGGSHVFVDMSGFAPGIYLLQVKGSNGLMKAYGFVR